MSITVWYMFGSLVMLVVFLVLGYILYDTVHYSQEIDMRTLDDLIDYVASVRAKQMVTPMVLSPKAEAIRKRLEDEFGDEWLGEAINRATWE